MKSETLIFSQLLSNEPYVRKVFAYLKEDYFSESADKIFFKIYSRYFIKHNAIPSKQAIAVEIENVKTNSDVYNSLKEVLTTTETFTENLEYLVTTTEQFCKTQALFNALRRAVVIADGSDAKVKESADSIPGILQEALSICFDTQIGHDYVEDADSRYEYYHKTENRIPTGISTLDEITKGGFPRKTLNLILAAPHSGKSLMMVNIAAGGIAAGYNVLFITLEMAAEEIAKRFDVLSMNITFDELENLPKQIFLNKVEQIKNKSKGILKIKEYPTMTAHSGHFKALLEELKTKQNYIPDMVVIDYAGICESSKYKASSGANSYTLQKSVSEELRALASEYNMVVISAIQTNRSGVENTDVNMTNMAESLGPAMTADLMLALVVSDELKEMKQIMCKQLKNRYRNLDDKNKFLLGVNYSKMKLYDLENSSVSNKTDKKKTSLIETSNDTFDIKPAKNNFDDFNFD